MQGRSASGIFTGWGRLPDIERGKLQRPAGALAAQDASDATDSGAKPRNHRDLVGFQLTVPSDSLT